jgi:transposase-like protein
MTDGKATRKGFSQAERALELYEKRLPMWVIAERLGVNADHLHEMIERARKNRDLAAGVVSE